jgi:hypothetical protein
MPAPLWGLGHKLQHYVVGPERNMMTPVCESDTNFV